MDRIRTIPFFALHLAVFAVFFVGWSPVALMTAGLLYLIRMFAITGFYHRYFSHRTFRTSRVMQFVFACIGASAAQRGPLWWAANHRVHHAHPDQPQDVHSPVHHGLWWSHMGWFLAQNQLATKLTRIKDFARYPELRFLNRYDVLVPIILAVSVFLLGEWLASAYPNLGRMDGKCLSGVLSFLRWRCGTGRSPLTRCPIVSAADGMPQLIIVGITSS